MSDDNDEEDENENDDSQVKGDENPEDREKVEELVVQSIPDVTPAPQENETPVAAEDSQMYAYIFI